MKKSFLILFLLPFLACGVENAPLSLTISIDKKDGVYPGGGIVNLSVLLKKEGKFFAGQKMGYYLSSTKSNKKFYPFTSNGKKQEFSIPIPHEYLFIEVAALDEQGKIYTYRKGGKTIAVKKSIGVVADPEKITTAIPEPADFRKYWDDALKELAEVPLKSTLKEVEVPARYKGKFQCYDVTVESLPGSFPVRGYLTIPVAEGEKKFPAIVYFHSAGVRGAVQRYENNFIVFDVNAHGVENGKDSFYIQNLMKNEMKGFLYKGYTKRETCVFRTVILRMKRALDFIKKHPLYDGKNLITYGGSQGGALAIITAGLDQDVTCVHAIVPALGDQGGALIPGRNAGWPYYIGVKNGKVLNKSIAASVIYYDTAYFAKYVKAKTFMTVGLMDPVCVPTAVFSIYNNLPAGKKVLVIHPSAGHGTAPVGEFLAWKKTLVSGK